MSDYKNKMKGLRGSLTSQKKTPIQTEVNPTKEITRVTVELDYALHEIVKQHIARPRRSFKQFAADAIIEKLRNEGVDV